MSRGKNKAKRLQAKVLQVVKETVTYPRIEVTAYYDPCLNPTTSCEHVLKCGHCIVTARPDELCGGNCFHVASTKGDGTDKRRAVKTGPDFWCDACVEEGIEMEIDMLHGHSLDARDADQRRASIRLLRTQADKETMRSFRRCYIAAKTVSVRCDSNGFPLKGYRNSPSTHPFDRATPRTGTNVFQDIDPNPPVERLKQLPSHRRSTKSRPETEADSVPHPRMIAAKNLTPRRRKANREHAMEVSSDSEDDIPVSRAARIRRRKKSLATPVMAPPPRPLPPTVAQTLTEYVLSTHLKRKRSKVSLEKTPPRKRRREQAVVAVEADSESESDLNVYSESESDSALDTRSDLDSDLDLDIDIEFNMDCGGGNRVQRVARSERAAARSAVRNGN